MPNSYVTKLADKHGMSVDKAEEHWSKAKDRAAAEGKGDDYAYITGIFKRMMGETAVTQVVAKMNVTTRLYEVLGALANQAQAKRFLQNIGLHPTKLGLSEDNYVSFVLSRDSKEQDVVNTISEALGRSGKKVAKDYGPPVKRITKTLRWLWEVPGKGAIVFYPSTFKVGFMNKIEDDPGEE